MIINWIQPNFFKQKACQVQIIDHRSHKLRCEQELLLNEKKKFIDKINIFILSYT
jgi:hypothetical protein